MTPTTQPWAAERSYAMVGAHPEVKELAKYLAPSNQEQGVVTVVSALLDAQA
uniref:HAD hydrolase family protein n=1 Tax=Pseudoclavibacter sp. RFBI5 TaxID=2080578 RepID=UPI0021572D15|nr:HAD hydrolase family protein [Pseudoclavibacter sp. RFBI5]